MGDAKLEGMNFVGEKNVLVKEVRTETAFLTKGQRFKSDFKPLEVYREEEKVFTYPVFMIVH